MIASTNIHNVVSVTRTELPIVRPDGVTVIIEEYRFVDSDGGVFTVSAFMEPTKEAT